LQSNEKGQQKAGQLLVIVPTAVVLADQ